MGLSSEQVKAVANLVVSSIPELSLQDVTVVDQKGNLLSRFDDSNELTAANKERIIKEKLLKIVGNYGKKVN